MRDLVPIVMLESSFFPLDGQLSPEASGAFWKNTSTPASSPRR